MATRIVVFVLMLAAIFGLAEPHRAFAQEAARPVLHAQRITTAPSIDIGAIVTDTESADDFNRVAAQFGSIEAAGT